MPIPLSTYLAASYHPFAILYTVNEEPEDTPSRDFPSLENNLTHTRLQTRSIKPTIAYQWNPEKAELTIVSRALGQFLKAYPNIVDSVQSLRLEASPGQSEAHLSQHLEHFQNLSALSLVGSFQNLEALSPILSKLEKLVCIHTRLALENIRVLDQCSKLQSLGLVGNAFIRGNNCVKCTFPRMASLKHIALDARNASLLHSFLSQNLPNLERLSLDTSCVSDSDLIALASLESLQSLALRVDHKILLTAVVPLQSKHLKELNFCFRGFVTKDSSKRFFNYFPALEVLHLEGNATAVHFYTPSLVGLKSLKTLKIHNVRLHGLGLEEHILQSKGIQLEYAASTKPFELHSRL
jgi:hypothetical protein